MRIGPYKSMHSPIQMQPNIGVWTISKHDWSGCRPHSAWPSDLYFILHGREYGPVNQQRCGVKWAEASWTRIGTKQEKPRQKLKKRRGQCWGKGRQEEKHGNLSILSYFAARKVGGSVYLFKTWCHLPPLLSLSSNVLFHLCQLNGYKLCTSSVSSEPHNIFTIFNNENFST